jgi:hypothetical protein
MTAQSRKLQYKTIRAAAASYVGTAGDVWYDQQTTALRFYNGEPGGEPLSAGGFSLTNYVDYGELPTNVNRPIDLTKKYHWLVSLNSNQQHYTLADGVDGQELVFFTASGYTGDDKCDMWVNSVYCYNGTTNYSSADRIVRIFDQETTNQIRTKTTAMWLNGGWHFDHHVLEIGPFL